MNMCQHAEQILQYAEDVKTYFEPWKLWQFRKKGSDAKWQDVEAHPQWTYYNEYQRKPEMLSVTLADGEVVSWPEPLNKLPEHDTQLWYLNGGSTYSCCNSHDNNYLLTDALKSGTLHLTEENAIQHIDALYKINNQHTRRLEWQ